MEYLLSENDMCQAIAEYLVEYENLNIDKGTIVFEKVENNNYLITVHEHSIELKN